MKVGDLVKSIYTGEVFIITAVANPPRTNTFGDGKYYEVSSKWQMPEEHLEVLSESR